VYPTRSWFCKNVPGRPLQGRKRLKIDENAREQYRGSPYFDRTAEFCALYDEVSFDADYASDPMATFEPMVRRVLRKDWTPPR